MTRRPRECRRGTTRFCRGGGRDLLFVGLMEREMNTQGRIFQGEDNMMTDKELLLRGKSRAKRVDRSKSYDFLQFTN